jgi:hypothetical protein
MQIGFRHRILAAGAAAMVVHTKVKMARITH